MRMSMDPYSLFWSNGGAAQYGARKGLFHMICTCYLWYSQCVLLVIYLSSHCWSCCSDRVFMLVKRCSGVSLHASARRTGVGRTDCAKIQLHNLKLGSRDRRLGLLHHCFASSDIGHLCRDCFVEAYYSHATCNKIVSPGAEVPATC